MRWLRTTLDPPSEPLARKDPELARLAEAGVRVVLFIPGCTTGGLCETARMLDKGRIPLRLAESTPLAECSNREGCACRYEPWPNAVLS